MEDKGQVKKLLKRIEALEKEQSSLNHLYRNFWLEIGEKYRADMEQQVDLQVRSYIIWNKTRGVWTDAPSERDTDPVPQPSKWIYTPQGRSP